MKRAKRNRKAPTLEPTAKTRDLAVTRAVDAGVKGGEEKPKVATPNLMLACATGKHIKSGIITV